MGAVPKKKPSQTRTRQRRSAWASQFKLPTTTRCQNCKAVKLMHRVCPECGMYRGRQVIEPKTKVRKVESKT